MPALIARLIPVLLVAFTTALVLYTGYSIHEATKGKRTQWILLSFLSVAMVIITFSLFTSAS